MPDSSLRHLNSYDVYQRFTYVTHTSQPSSSIPCCSGSLPSCLTARRHPCGGYIVRRASHPTVTSDACLPRLLLVA
ncbi:hypothetical protein CNECB9_2490005 [Cupriavidus necator]|uniref:Uncharacterized protein n=1 Tax=Cupriavidus necator TaxID=106590 RepID=A0A1K0J9I4_CUPNE|nr:hypothetical protein CNECB9_2490005 [Cupriavidus necator]